MPTLSFPFLFSFLMPSMWRTLSLPQCPIVRFPLFFEAGGRDTEQETAPPLRIRMFSVLAPHSVSVSAISLSLACAGSSCLCPFFVYIMVPTASWLLPLIESLQCALCSICCWSGSGGTAAAGVWCGTQLIVDCCWPFRGREWARSGVFAEKERHRRVFPFLLYL